MKIALGHRIQKGPWGGGNRFASALADALLARGDHVVFDLKHDDIDLILLIDPRARNPAVPFTLGQIFRHRLSHPKVKVLHRINECDERKGTFGMNARLRLANYLADHTVFIGSWLTELDIWRRESTSSVILNGADEQIFNGNGHIPWSGDEVLRLVTHHWGGHAMKGMDVYQKLDQMMAEGPLRGRFALTYVGNLPQGFAFRNATHVPPLNGSALADELKRHHAYVTASVNEPAGMHHIEGALCGLPLLFRNSGALPEYCDSYGEIYSGPEDVGEALVRLMAGYARHREALRHYPHTSTRMVGAYLNLIDDTVSTPGDWQPWRSPLAAALIQLPL
ncbi:MAG: hypothetical protein HQL43_07865 [Alphaproteobacteria bacterium]|nr:hypothetical protein [Alphaproteobacteria bacterium]